MPKSRNRRTAAAESVTEGLQAILDSAKEFLNTLSDQKGAAVDDLRGRLSATVDSTTQRLNSLRAQASDAGVRAAKSTLGYARREPWRVAAIAVLAIVAWQVVSHLTADDDSDDND